MGNTRRRLWVGICRSIVVTIPIAACSTGSPVSSPEGTVTTYTENSGVALYAPRGARAQKVVFDTSDENLIHEPDTPFRKFFNAHAQDFGAGKLDYAKTTILNGILRRLENKAYIRDMVEEVVDAHDDAINATNRVQSDKTDNAKEKVDAKAKKAGTPEAAAKEKALRERNKKLLIDAIYFALLREDYPNVRDGDIERIVEQFCTNDEADERDDAIDATSKDEEVVVRRQFRTIWETATSGTGLRKRLRLAMKQALRERLFFRSIIDASIDKRTNLFVGASSPAARLGKNEKTLTEFVNKNMGERSSIANALAESWIAGEDSLWVAFAKAQSGTTGPLSVAAAEQGAFFKTLRGLVVAELKKTKELNTAMAAVFENDAVSGRLRRDANGGFGEAAADPGVTAGARASARRLRGAVPRLRRSRWLRRSDPQGARPALFAVVRQPRIA